jgi:hypothetical protein
MKYPVLEQQQAHSVLDRMDPPYLEMPSVLGVSERAGAGEWIGDQVIAELTSLLLDVRGRISSTKAFDAEACVIVHQLIPNDPELLADDGFWRWLALGPLQEIVAWRFPPAPRKTSDGEPLPPTFNRENFGVGVSPRQRSECFPYKLWIRAELGRVDDGGDKYRFARRGDVDFWTSHVLRQAYTTNRRLCAALVRFQFPDRRGGRPWLHPGTERPSVGIRGVRTLAKRIKRLQASCELSILEESELEELLSEHSQDLTLAT